MNQLDIFKKCIADEADAILKTLDFFGEEVIQAIEIIKNTKGHLIITGVGKSGHIGKKMAASMASTGTPAFFMHATEGVHGDLGMVTANDTVLMISNSGETKELLNLLPSLNKIGVKKISLSRNHNSTMAKSCDVSIAYNYEREADDLGLAPTVSSTLTLVVADALAVTLSKLKNFKPEDFHLYHPGGSLGKMLEKK